jgi:UDP-glucose 4-epimerase
MDREKWLITGGAGYIGTHIADLFIADGKDVVLLDSLYQGLSSRVDYLRKKHNTDIPLEVVDIRDYTAIENILEKITLPGLFTQQRLRQLANLLRSQMNTRKLTSLQQQSC